MKDEIDSLELSLMNVGYGEFDGDWNFGPICSAVSRVYWVTEGKAFVTLNGETHTLHPNHLYLIPAFVSHYDKCETIFRHHYLHIADISQNILQLYERYDLPFELDIEERDKAIFRRLTLLCPKMKLLRAVPDTYENSSCYLEYSHRFNVLPIDIKMEVKGLLMILLSRFLNKGTVHSNVNDKRIVRAQRMIEKNMKETPSIGQIASDISLCKSSFIRLFHKETGMAPNEYIIRKKVLRAQMLLINKDLSIKEIAAELGYDNVSYFCRVFTKIIGMSPLKFKKQNL
jgi:AraC-like DNA-binding protein